MQELNLMEIEEVGGALKFGVGDGVATVGGVLTGVAAAALVIETGGAVLGFGLLGGAIWEGLYKVAYE